MKVSIHQDKYMTKFSGLMNKKMFKNKFVEYEREKEEQMLKRYRIQLRLIEANNDNDDFNVIHHINDQEENEIIVDQNYEANYWTDEHESYNEQESSDDEMIVAKNTFDHNFDEYDETNMKEIIIKSTQSEMLTRFRLEFSMNNTSFYKQTFNIADSIETLLNRIFFFSPPSDEYQKFNKHFERCIGETMRYLNQISSFHNFTQSARSDILSWFSFATCSKDVNLSNNKTSTEINNYQPPIMLLKYDICPSHGCEVFVGQSSENQQCSECSEFRFKACNNPICIKRKMENSCHHLRPAIKQIYYRPLIGYISKLLVNELFINLIKFRYVKKNSFQTIDIIEGVSAKRNMSEMKLKYNSLQNKDSYISVNLLFSMFFDGVQIHKSKTSVFWPLFITILNLPPSFRSTPHAGIFLNSIFTCKLGSNAEKFLMYECLLNELLLLYEGIFLTINNKQYFVQARLISHVFDTKGLEKIMDFASTTNSKYGSPFVYNGVRGVFFSHLKKVAFVNDLRMYSDINHITRKVGQSRKCCPYQTGGEMLTEKDYYNNWEDIIIGDTSNTLDPNNIGTLDTNINPNPNKNNKSTNKNKSSNNNDKKTKKNSILSSSNETSFLTTKLCFLHDIDNKILTKSSTIEQLIEFKNELQINIRKKKDFFVWHHFRHDKKNKICKNLYFSHCCYKYRPYVRINQNDYKNAVQTSDNANKHNIKNNDEDKEIIDDGENESQSTSSDICSKIIEDYDDTFTRGIKGGNSLFNKLPYANIETDLHWDVMHLIKNISVHLLDLISGQRLKDKDSVRTHCAKTGCHKSYSETGIEPWVISEANKCRVDVFLSSILIPKGYSDKFQIRTIFKRSSFINSNGHLCIIRSLLNLIGFIGELPYVYQEFLSMVQYDFNEILRPKFGDDYDFEELFKLLNETAICKAGLFPVSEIFFEWLQILDIPHSLKVNGPVRGYWAFTGERFNNEVMNYTKIGGYNSELTTIKSNSAVADEYLENLYKQTLEDISTKKIKNKGLNTKKLFDINHTEIKESTVLYNDEKTRFFDHGNTKTTKVLKLNAFECECLLKSIIYDNFDILNQSNIHSINSTLTESSWLYRISLSFQFYHINSDKKIKRKEFKCLTFLSFLKRLEELAPKNMFGINSNVNINFNSGEIRFEDYISVFTFLNENSIEINNNGVIKGVSFSSQGEIFRQQENSRNSNPSSNYKNLKSSWHNKASYSSWFKFNKDLYESYKELYRSEEFGNYFINGEFHCDIYGQFNFFFELNNYRDSLIASNKYTSVTVRRTINYNNNFYQDNRNGLHHLPVIEMEIEEAKRNYIHNLIFASDKLIHSSPVFILPIHTEYAFGGIKAIKPKKVNKDENETFWDIKTYKQYYVTDLDYATHLIMIDIERNRMNSNVTLVESDENY